MLRKSHLMIYLYSSTKRKVQIQKVIMGSKGQHKLNPFNLLLEVASVSEEDQLYLLLNLVCLEENRLKMALVLEN